MTRFLLKLRLLFLPFILWGIGFTGIYTFLHWLLVLELEVIDLKDMVVQFALPGLFTGVFVLFWFRKRIKLLHLKTKGGGDLPFLYQIVVLIALCIPVIIAQHYIVTATGKLAALQHIGELNKQEKSRYYTFQEYYIDKHRVRFYPSSEISGKHNEHLDLSIHAAVPILRTAADSSSAEPLQGWMGVEFERQISNKLSSQEKEEAYNVFLNDSWQEFTAMDLQRFAYLARIGNSSDLDNYRKAVKGENKQNADAEPVILVPVHEPFAARNGNKLFWIFGSLGIGAIVWLLMISIPKFSQYQLIMFQSGKPRKDRELQEFLSIFILKEGYFVTPLILNLNLALFTLMVISGLGFLSFSGQDLLNWGANIKPLVQDGDWWRLISNVFLHAGIMHLIMNMTALLFAGAVLEPFLGRIKFAALYLITGLAASLASFWCYERTISVGASGAIFGLYGFFIVLLVTNVFPKGLKLPLLLSAGIFVTINLVMGLVGSGTDNAAHIGGLISGIVLGLGYYLSIYNQLEEEPEERPEELTSV